VGSFIPKKMGLFVSAKNKEGTGAKPKKMKQACIKDPRYEINNPKEACFIFFNGNEQSPQIIYDVRALAGKNGILLYINIHAASQTI
jgi:hypothetical protein